MYSDHFNLEVLPFESTPDPAFFYPGPQYRETLAAMIHCVASHKSLMVVSGPIGSGKTTLGRTLTRYLSEGTQLISILHPFSARGELLSFVAHQLGLEELSGSKLLQVEELNKRLIQLTEQGKRILIIIDEAQLLSLENMEEIRLITNLETETVKLVQIILLGQSELIQHLQAPEARPLRQRLASVKILKPLERTQVMSYIRHRLKVAGGNPELFSTEALEAVASASGGIPRIINQICDQSLLAAFAAEAPSVELAAVRQVVAEMTEGQSLPPRPERDEVMPPEERPEPVPERSEPAVEYAEEEELPGRDPERPLYDERPPEEEPAPEFRQTRAEPVELVDVVPEEPEAEEPLPEEEQAPEAEQFPVEEPPDEEPPLPDEPPAPEEQVPPPAEEDQPPVPEPPAREPDRTAQDYYSGGVESKLGGDPATLMGEDSGIEAGPIFRPAMLEEREEAGEGPGSPDQPGDLAIGDATPLRAAMSQPGPEPEEDLEESPSLSKVKSWAPPVLLLILALVALGASLWIFFNQL